MVIGADRQVAATNRALDSLIGSGLVGRNFVTALRQPLLLDAVEEAIATDRDATGRYLGRDGGNDTVYLVHIMRNRGRTVLTFEDQTAAQTITQFRRDFVANVSHELRTPLTALQGFIETLRGPARDDATARERFLGIMDRETKRMSRLVGDLLSLSHVEENARIRPDDTVIPAELVRMACAELGPVITAAGAEVSIDDQSEEARIPGDPGQLRQVVGNLIENAVKYGAEGGKVEIVLGPVTYQKALRGDGLALTIVNGGQGIAAHHIPRLTERFYRVDDSRSREIGGTGLGLAIVKHIVMRHRGRLSIESDLGAPTVVTVVLPAAVDGSSRSVG